MKHKPLQHIAFIMDGNRRWARKHVFSLFQAHNKGAENIEPLVDFAEKLKIPYLTFWAFSTENWRRPEEEVSVLIEIMRRQLQGEMMKRLKQKHVKVVVIGDITKFPKDIQTELHELMEETFDNNAITVALALNYGGRQELIAAVKNLAESEKHEITEEIISGMLYTRELPDPDLIIRTGGEKRLSGFLPWQSIYSELYFTDTLWPDFSTTDLQDALADYAKRQRRFGG